MYKIIVSTILILSLTSCGVKKPIELYKKPEFTITQPTYVVKHMPKYIIKDGLYTLTDEEFKKVIRNRVELISYIKKIDVYIKTIKEYCKN